MSKARIRAMERRVGVSDGPRLTDTELDTMADRLLEAIDTMDDNDLTTGAADLTNSRLGVDQAVGSFLKSRWWRRQAVAT